MRFASSAGSGSVAIEAAGRCPVTIETEPRTQAQITQRRRVAKSGPIKLPATHGHRQPIGRGMSVWTATPAVDPEQRELASDMDRQAEIVGAVDIGV